MIFAFWGGMPLKLCGALLSVLHLGGLVRCWRCKSLSLLRCVCYFVFIS